MPQLPSSPKFAVIGDPINQSLSPEIHLPVLRHYAEAPVFERIQVRKGELPQWIARVREEGFSGFKVTMPHKMDIGQYLDELVMEADLTGSVNTVINRGGKLIGYSTDALGFFTALRESGVDYDDKRILILGAGGTASTLAHRALLEHAARVEVLARRPEQARQAVTAIRSQLRNAKLSWDSLDMHTLHRSAARADIIINATPQGMEGVDAQWEDLAFLQSLPSHAVVCDIIHAPRKTAFLAEAERLGFATRNGVDMLICQALVSSHLFLDLDIDYPAMAKVIKEVVYRESGLIPESNK